MFKEAMKTQRTKVLPGAILIFIGVVIGIVGSVLMWIQSRPDQKSIEELQKNYVIEHTQKEQARLGIKCGELRVRLRDFLEKDIRPVLDSRQSGEGWSRHVSASLREKTEKMRDDFLVCNRLYLAGRNGEWNGLTDVGFTVEIEREFLDLYTLIRFGESGGSCDAACVEQQFQDLNDIYKTIETALQ